MKRRTKILISVGSFLTLGLAVGAAAIVTSLQNRIGKRLEKGWVIPPLELYSQGFSLSAGRRFSLQSLQEELDRRQLQAGRDYRLYSGTACNSPTALPQNQSTEGFDSSPNEIQCLWLRDPNLVVVWQESWILSVYAGEPLSPVSSYALFPRLITQFYDGQPIQQQNTPLSEVPLSCLQAVTAIEDRDFLEHGGVSATGMLRALLRNLRKGRWAEGGSTITQQLVKNFFLNPKKTIRRKVEEQLLAILLESQLTKDQILEMYLNVIYMGQNGPYQVRGFGSASQYYFGKPVSQLGLPDCALLAALINSPGRYNPIEHPDSARTRRELVLRKMSEAGMIDTSEMAEANHSSLPGVSSVQQQVHAPYFVMSALKEFQSWDLEAEEGAKLYTTLDPDVQRQIADSVSLILPKVERRIRKPSRQPLEVAVITIDLFNSQILGLIGGHDYRATQYNRATDSRRQIGSIVKPFVYWAAMDNKENSPLTSVMDEPFEWKMAGQTWKPKNYENGNLGPVPYFYALAESLNVPAAKVGQQVGLQKVAQTVQRSGIHTDIPLLPSLTLGAFELSLAEVAQGYATLARMGQNTDYVHTLEKVEDHNGNVIFSREPAHDLGLDPIPTALLIGMMKQSFEIGTAKSAQDWGISGPYAGKTGTTSDTKDAWFAGFNGRLLSVVWVGYDDNTAMGLTGAGAALPIWADLTQKLEFIYKPQDFKWPSEVELQAVPREKILEKFPALKSRNLPERIDLVFPSWAS